jgi:hypothetical protein
VGPVVAERTLPPLEGLLDRLPPPNVPALAQGAAAVAVTVDGPAAAVDGPTAAVDGPTPAVGGPAAAVGGPAAVVAGPVKEAVPGPPEADGAMPHSSQ